MCGRALGQFAEAQCHLPQAPTGDLCEASAHYPHAYDCAIAFTENRSSRSEQIRSAYNLPDRATWILWDCGERRRLERERGSCDAAVASPSARRSRDRGLSASSARTPPSATSLRPDGSSSATRSAVGSQRSGANTRSTRPRSRTATTTTATTSPPTTRGDAPRPAPLARSALRVDGSWPASRASPPGRQRVRPSGDDDQGAGCDPPRHVEPRREPHHELPGEPDRRRLPRHVVRDVAPEARVALTREVHPAHHRRGDDHGR